MLFISQDDSAQAMGWPVHYSAEKRKCIPDWLREEMLSLARLEYEINPNVIQNRGFEFAPLAIHPAGGRVYRKLMHLVVQREGYDYILVAPWIKMGGADLVTLCHLRYLAKRRVRALLILTEASHSTWLDKVPKEIDVLQFGQEASWLSALEQESVLMRLLIQLEPRCVHNINSRLAWNCIRSSGKTLAAVSNVYVSLYCDDYDKDGCPVGYGREFLRESAPYIRKIFTDNSNYPEQICATYGLPLTLFEVVRIPTDESLLKLPIRRAEGIRKVIWSGRFDPQKRPDLLLQVAKILPEVEFHVYGQAVVSGRNKLSHFESQKNITVFPPYSNFHAVARNYRVLLNTSAWDGLPNILVEAAASGMIIVTSNVGGIADLVDERTGWLVHEHSDPKAYAEAIVSCFSDMVDWSKKGESARSRVLENHSWGAFECKLDEVFTTTLPLNADSLPQRKPQMAENRVSD
ncbi:glycosyltransferase family 4 protein [Microbulbifer sp. Q7]|uniref:glycosyltransferase family 4 protein n=1 Tax=Microbulbifer sp. Q7 TaxID=1785091 RepID=UPI00187CCA31|nr:glycosyltransferase family 4 protein [Microbulbifer sp. Q7]